jgi:hypothetical protein
VVRIRDDPLAVNHPAALLVEALGEGRADRPAVGSDPGPLGRVDPPAPVSLVESVHDRGGVLHRRRPIGAPVWVLHGVQREVGNAARHHADRSPGPCSPARVAVAVASPADQIAGRGSAHRERPGESVELRCDELEVGAPARDRVHREGPVADRVPARQRREVRDLVRVVLHVAPVALRFGAGGDLREPVHGPAVDRRVLGGAGMVHARHDVGGPSKWDGFSRGELALADTVAAARVAHGAEGVVERVVLLVDHHHVPDRGWGGDFRASGGCRETYEQDRRERPCKQAEDETHAERVTQCAMAFIALRNCWAVTAPEATGTAR